MDNKNQHDKPDLDPVMVAQWALLGDIMRENQERYGEDQDWRSKVKKK